MFKEWKWIAQARKIENDVQEVQDQAEREAEANGRSLGFIPCSGTPLGNSKAM